MGKTWAELNRAAGLEPRTAAEARRIEEQGRAISGFLYRFGRRIALELLPAGEFYYHAEGGRWWQDCGGVAVELPAVVVFEDVLKRMGDEVDGGRHCEYDRVLEERRDAVERAGMSGELIHGWIGYALERVDSPLWQAIRAECGKGKRGRAMTADLWLSMRWDAETGQNPAPGGVGSG